LSRTPIPHVGERIVKLTAGLPPADRRVQDLLRRRHAGFLAAQPDLALGAKVYEKNCAACHQVGGKGARVGP
jgi:mono/diheme cytochrome c family protein